MTLQSMTGFARTDGVHGDTSWFWEIRSVNGRSLDLR
ncbi:YicC/YloC family endoribonuclease, partial [Methyloceanibacter marginalis]